MTPLAAVILAGRQINDPAEAEAFLSPSLASLSSPSVIAGLPAAVERLSRAFNHHERIAVFGDYDADGVTAAALIIEVVRHLGGDVRGWLANRFELGYGMQPGVIEAIAEDDRTLAVVVDCGTSDLEAIDLARSRGVDLIIVDHHRPSRGMPEVAALINSHQPGCGLRDEGLAAVGLAFYFMSALRAEREPELDMRRWLDLVAVGTIADVAPMKKVNRTLVRGGLRRLALAPRPGLAALQMAAGAHRMPTADTVAFKLGPRLNAAGRLGDPMVALELLLASDHDEAAGLAARLDELSQQRRSIQREIISQAVPEAERQARQGRKAIVVARPGWHQGVAGIVAARLCDDFDRPAGIISVEGGEGRGSLRAPAGYDLAEALERCGELLDRYGGHSAAAGFSVRAESIEPFIAAFTKEIERQERSRGGPATLELEAEICGADLSLAVVNDLEMLGPFGLGNPEPALFVSGAQVSRLLDRTGGHIAAELEVDGVRVTAFGPRMGGIWPRSAPRVDLACTLRRNTYHAMDRVELRVIDVKTSE